LSGISNLVRDDDYELVVTLPPDVEFIRAGAIEDVVTCTAHMDDPDADRYNTIKVQLKSPANQKVNWYVVFN